MPDMSRDALSLVMEYAQIEKKIAPSVERLAEIKVSLGKLLPRGKTASKVGDVTVTENATYPFKDSSLTKGQVARITKKVVDTDKWKATYPADYASTKKVAENPVKVSVSIHAIK